jgi:hypothetical protein
MVPSSSITITADGEHQVCSRLSLGETIHLGNFEFIADYFGSLSLSPRRGDKGATFVGSTHYGACTPQWGMIEDSIEEFLTPSCGEGSFGHPSPRRRSTESSLTSATTTTWKENALAMMKFCPWTTTPWPETNFPLEWCHTYHE